MTSAQLLPRSGAINKTFFFTICSPRALQTANIRGADGPPTWSGLPRQTERLVFWNPVFSWLFVCLGICIVPFLVTDLLKFVNSLLNNCDCACFPWRDLIFPGCGDNNLFFSLALVLLLYLWAHSIGACRCWLNFLNSCGGFVKCLVVLAILC